jgi:hypothetical protein
MKLSFALVSFAAVTVNATSLRQSGGSSALETKVSLKGVSGEPSKADLDFLGKALVASYNNVHWEAGHFLTGEHSTEFVGQLCKYW